MSTWALIITDSSGSKTCKDCRKAEPRSSHGEEVETCISGITLKDAHHDLVTINDRSHLYPEQSGWGSIRVSCMGFVPNGPTDT